MPEKYFSVDGKKFHSSARLVFLHNTNQFENVGLSLINMLNLLSIHIITWRPNKKNEILNFKHYVKHKYDLCA